MKQLTLHSEAYRYSIASFKEWLETLGYSVGTSTDLPIYTQEFLHYAEKKGYAGLHQLSVDLMKEYYDYLKGRPNMRRAGALSSVSLNKRLYGLHKFNDWLRSSGRLLLPKLDIGMELVEDEVTDIVTQGEIKQVYGATELPYEVKKNGRGIVYYEALQLRDRAMLGIFYGCGLRRSEAVHLDIRDIQLERGVIHVRKGKGNKERLVPFTHQVLEHLQSYLYEARPYFVNDKTEAFLVNHNGKRMSGQGMLVRLRVLIGLTGNAELQSKDIHLHSLRHSIATHLLQNGMKLEKIKDFLGHSSLESTQIYTHFLEQENKQGYHGADDNQPY